MSGSMLVRFVPFFNCIVNSERKIVKLCWAAMLFGKNMLNMERTPKGSLRNQAIFAAILRSSANLSCKLGHE